MKFSLELPREALSIPVIRRVLGDMLHGLGVSGECIADILVAASEACTNVVRHADAASRYDIIASIGGGYCVLKVADRGGGFDGEVESERVVPADSETGRGITIMRALVDDVSFDSGPERGTVVYLHKRLTWQDGSLMAQLERELMEAAG